MGNLWFIRCVVRLRFISLNTLLFDDFFAFERIASYSRMPFFQHPFAFCFVLYFCSMRNSFKFVLRITSHLHQNSSDSLFLCVFSFVFLCFLFHFLFAFWIIFKRNVHTSTYLHMLLRAKSSRTFSRWFLNSATTKILRNNYLLTVWCAELFFQFICIQHSLQYNADCRCHCKTLFFLFRFDEVCFIPFTAFAPTFIFFSFCSLQIFFSPFFHLVFARFDLVKLLYAIRNTHIFI